MPYVWNSMTLLFTKIYVTFIKVLKYKIFIIQDLVHFNQMMIYGFKMATYGEDVVWVVIITLSTMPCQTVPMCCDQQTEFKTEFEK